jgi:hypothetical protein
MVSLGISMWGMFIDVPQHFVLYISLHPHKIYHFHEKYELATYPCGDYFGKPEDAFMASAVITTEMIREKDKKLKELNHLDFMGWLHSLHLPQARKAPPRICLYHIF